MAAPCTQALLIRQPRGPPGSGGGAHIIRFCFSTQVLSTRNKPLIVQSSQLQLQELIHTTTEGIQGTGQAQGSDNSQCGMITSTPKSRLDPAASG